MALLAQFFYSPFPCALRHPSAFEVLENLPFLRCTLRLATKESQYQGLCPLFLRGLPDGFCPRQPPHTLIAHFHRAILVLLVIEADHKRLRLLNITRLDGLDRQDIAGGLPLDRKGRINPCQEVR
jgi:hypothetical protein